MASKTEQGRHAEGLVCDYLKQNGFAVMHRNFMCGRGEIDIVAENGEIVLLVEVRLRKRGAVVTGAESITAKKADTMRKCANEYIMRTHLNNLNVRIDVAQVESYIENGKLQYDLTYFENAVRAGVV